MIDAFAQRFDIHVTASGQQRETIVFNLPLESAPLIAGGQIIRTVSRYPFHTGQAYAA